MDGNCCSDISAVQNECYGRDTLGKVCRHGSVRLVDGLTSYDGRLEFCAHGRWGRVCNSLNFWGPDNAKVVCRQLGFPERGVNSALFCNYLIMHNYRGCLYPEPQRQFKKNG